MRVEAGAFIPSQYKPDSRFMNRTAAAHEAAELAKNGEPFFWDNGPVYAWPGDANDPYLQAKITGIKQERNTKQPLGWTVPYSHSLDLIDKNRIGGKDMQSLLDNPDDCTSRTAGLTFIRAAADMKRKRERNIPDSIIPSDVASPMVQLYSANGNDVTSAFVRMLMVRGGEPVMTSANPSGSPEFIHSDQAHKFADSVGIKVFVNWQDEEKPERPRGSYPILGVADETEIAGDEKGRFELVREGCFGIDILQRVLNGYTLVETPATIKSKYPDHIMTMADIEQIASENQEFAELPKLYGPEFRVGLMAVLKFQFHNWEIHKAGVQGPFSRL